MLWGPLPPTQLETTPKLHAYPEPLGHLSPKSTCCFLLLHPPCSATPPCPCPAATLYPMLTPLSSREPPGASPEAAGAAPPLPTAPLSARPGGVVTPLSRVQLFPQC